MDYFDVSDLCDSYLWYAQRTGAVTKEDLITDLTCVLSRQINENVIRLLNKTIETINKI